MHSKLKAAAKRLASVIRPTQPASSQIEEPASEPVPVETVPIEPATQSRFELRPPSNEVMVDLFKGKWASDLTSFGATNGGKVHLFHDSRPHLAAKALGRSSSFSGMRVLELGPLEAAHTCELERLGAAEVVAVEANTEAFLKCLIVKELAGLTRSRFLLGDVVQYLGMQTKGRFDLIFCSGILYHMADPLRLIREICRITDKCFIWTHFYDPQQHNLNHTPSEVIIDGFKTTYWTHVYGEKSDGFWGGNLEAAAWLTRDDILNAFSNFGLTSIDVIREDRKFINGPNIMFAAKRTIGEQADCHTDVERA